MFRQKQHSEPVSLGSRLLLLVAVVIVAVLVTLTYFYFEAAVSNSIHFIWDSVFQTNKYRLVVIPLCVVISFIFFGLQHYFDRPSEQHESQGLGEAPKPTISNFVKVIGIGFFSLLAGASLGPEAILVPASIVIGGYIGSHISKENSKVPKLLGMAGFIALLAAFFNSFLVGLLGLFLIGKQLKLKINLGLIAVAALASIITVYVLKILKKTAYAQVPHTAWKISALSLLALVLLFAGGYVSILVLGIVHKRLAAFSFSRVKDKWWLHALVAAIGLSIIYLLGGNLVEFTGNESIIPMLQRAATLGFVGLLWVLIIKLIAITWSKSLGYRGGMVFPIIFVASVLVAIAQHFVPSTSFMLGLVAAMAGIILANRKLKILF